MTRQTLIKMLYSMFRLKTCCITIADFTLNSIKRKQQLALINKLYSHISIFICSLKSSKLIKANYLKTDTR